MKIGFHGTAKGKANHIIAPAIGQPSVVGDFLINQKSFDSLSKDLQAILETAMNSFALTTTLKGKVLDMQALGQFRKNGIKISKWSDEDLKIWKEKAIEVYSKYRGKSANFKIFLMIRWPLNENMVST